MFELIAPKGGSACLPGHPTKQLCTQRHGPRTRPRQSGPRSLTTPQSRRRAASASRTGPSVAGLGLQPGERALRAEAELPVAPSPAGLTRPLSERTKQGRPSARRGPDHFRAAASAPPTPPPRTTLFLFGPRAASPGCCPHRGTGKRVGSTMHPTEVGRRVPEARMGLDSHTYIFPPPKPPPALLSR